MGPRVMGLYSCLPLLVVHYDLVRFPGLLSGASAVLSFAIALLIGFRVNAAYDRWWEARKLWGTLVNISRNLAVKVRELERPDETERQHVRNLIVAFCFGLKDHLRDEPDLEKAARISDRSNDPEASAQLCHEASLPGLRRVADRRQECRTDGFGFWIPRLDSC